LQPIKEMISEYVDVSSIPEEKWLVFENHVQTLIERMQDDEQYTEDVVAFEVSDEAKQLTERIASYLTQTYEKDVTPFEQSMVLLHIGSMIDQM